MKYLNLLEESFPGIKDNILRCEILGFPWKSKPFLKTDNGEIVSHVGLLEYPMLIDGQECKAGALHAICTQLTHRHQGFASTLIQEALEGAKEHYECLLLFTEIPAFYEKLSFHYIQEYRFHLPCQHSKRLRSLVPMTFPRDNDLFRRIFHERSPVSNHVWVNDTGTIASFNTLFATYPTYWSLHYSPSIDGVISYLLKDKTLHLFDIIAKKIPSLEVILEHVPTAIKDIYFYFSPDYLTNSATLEPYLYDNGYLMAYGSWPHIEPFMISPLSRC